MQIHSNLSKLPAFKNGIVTIGSFDGVHTGHRQIIAQLKKEALETSGESVIITFSPHPRMVIGSKPNEVKLLNTPEEKIELLQAAEIDHLVMVPFTKEFAELSAIDYVESFLIQKIHPHTIIIGYDHRFGNNREGDFQLLEKLKQRFQFKLKEIPPHVLHNSNISSTKIRNAIKLGDISEANECLGYNYFFSGLIVEGNKIGRTIGYPTANISLAEDGDKLVPANGVYAVTVDIIHNTSRQNGLKGMMNIGIRPTIGGVKRVIEVNIFNFNEDIYGQTLKVYVLKHLRSEVKFSGLEALKNQLAIDKIQAEDALM